MKKWTGIILSIIVVLILISYFAIGFLIENTLYKNINSIPKSSAFNIQLNKYHRGWFSSRAAISLKMHIPAQTTTDNNGITKTEPSADIDMEFPVLIKHGPFIITSYGLRFGAGLVTTQPETHYQAFISYLNRTIFRYTLPSFAMEGKIGQNEGNFQFSWQGLSSLIRVASNLDHIDGNFKLLGMKGAANNPSNPQNNLTFDIGKISYDYQFKQHQDWLWIGKTRFKIPSLDLNLAGKHAFGLTQFIFQAGSDVTSDNQMNVDLKVSLQKLLVMNQNYGPGVFHLSIRNLDPAVAAQINQQEFNLIQNNSDPNLIILALATESPKLLAKGAVFELSEMNLTVPEGKITGNFKLAVPQNQGNDLSHLMQNIYGEGHFRAPIATIKSMVTASLKSNNSQPNANVQSNSPPINTDPTQILVKPENEALQADNLLKNLVDKGFLKIEGNDYSLTFKIENQKILINGVLFHPEMMK